MSKLFHRPNQAVDYGQVQTYGSGNVLGDDNNSTGKWYVDAAGSVMLFPAFNPALIPSGKEIIAVKVGHTQINGGTFGVFNGWVMSYLRIKNTRVASTKAYKQDGSGGARSIEGPALYKPGLVPWTAAEISTMNCDLGAATGEFGPNKSKIWCGATEAFIVIVLSDDVIVPNTPYPANGQTIDSSSVNFNAVAVPTQPEQPVAAIFQVARDPGFTQSVKTFIGGLNQDMTAGAKSYYASTRTNSTYTNLGPGQWYMRMKGRDHRGVESAWGVTTTFNIVHGALPTPSLSKPAAGTSVPTPYGTREALFSTDPSGDRIVGAQWQFSKSSDFSTGVVSWTNSTVGRFDKGAVSYEPAPDATVTPGLNGAKVSSDDPSQYLSQGTWYGRVRAADIWGQFGSWSSAVTFTVSHPPVVSSVRPAQGKAFDDDATPVRWSFTDPWSGDIQSAYRVSVFDSSNSLVYDTGKVLSSVPQASVVIPDSLLLATLTLGITIWDRDDVQGTTWVSTFFLSKSPVIALNYPAPDESIITGQPSLTWSVVYSRPGVIQKSYQIAFIRRDTAVIEYQTAVVNGTATTWTAPTAVLKNVSEYQLALTITDSDDLQTTLLRNFSTDYVRPASVYADAYSLDYEKDGYVLVIFPDAQPDPLFVEYRIYRKNEDIEGSEWELAGVLDDRDALEYHDWGVSGNRNYRYTVTQVNLMFGALVESLQDEYGPIVSVHSSDYWLIVPGEEELNVRLYHVVGDKFTRKVEMSEYNIIGGGRRINYGAAIGIDGTLSAQVRDNETATATQQLNILEQLQLESRWVMMRDPFGNYTKIALGEIAASRIAGVIGEFSDIEIPYYEVM